MWIRGFITAEEIKRCCQLDDLLPAGLLFFHVVFVGYFCIYWTCKVVTTLSKRPYILNQLLLLLLPNNIYYHYSRWWLSIRQFRIEIFFFFFQLLLLLLSRLCLRPQLFGNYKRTFQSASETLKRQRRWCHHRNNSTLAVSILFCSISISFHQFMSFNSSTSIEKPSISNIFIWFNGKMI